MKYSLKDVREYKTAMKKVHEVEVQGAKLHSNFVSKLSETKNNITRSEKDLSFLEEQIKGSGSKLDEINREISEKEKVLQEKNELVEKKIQDLQKQAEPYEIKLKHMEKLAKKLPNDSFYTSKEELFQIVDDYLPNRLGTDRELKASNILKLIEQANFSVRTVITAVTTVVTRNKKICLNMYPAPPSDLEWAKCHF